MAYEENEVLKRLPDHLRQFINNHDYESSTPIDQEVWLYVMRKNVDYLQKVAHESYIGGLKKTGISTEYIPSMYGMNRILKDIGWAAVAVDGFIPPTAFMEFQAYNVLVIAEDIRQIQNIEYTPAPDIMHESAGHEPIIVNHEYAEYLRRCGEIGSIFRICNDGCVTCRFVNNIRCRCIFYVLNLTKHRIYTCTGYYSRICRSRTHHCKS